MHTMGFHEPLLLYCQQLAVKLAQWAWQEGLRAFEHTKVSPWCVAPHRGCGWNRVSYKVVSVVEGLLLQLA